MSIAYLQEKVSTTSLRSVPLTVLYVASDGSRRDNLRCILRQSNWNLLSASNLEEARQQLGAQPVSVLLLDWLVPEAVCFRPSRTRSRCTVWSRDRDARAAGTRRRYVPPVPPTCAWRVRSGLPAGRNSHHGQPRWTLLARPAPAFGNSL